MNAVTGAWDRIKADFAANPGVWVGVGVSAVVLYFVWAAYQQNQSSAGLQTPANGYGSPDWGSASGGIAPGSVPNNQELQNEIASLQAYMANPQTPNPPAAASPASSTPVASFAAASPTSSPSSYSAPAAAPAPAPATVQNPLAPAQLLHRYGTTSFPQPVYSAKNGGQIQNPLVAAQAAHNPYLTKATYTDSGMQPSWGALSSRIPTMSVTPFAIHQNVR